MYLKNLSLLDEETIDFEYYLTSSMIPSVDMDMVETTAQIEMDKLTASISPVSVSTIAVMSVSTANNVIASMAKVIVDSRYKVTVDENDTATLEEGIAYQIWRGTFKVENMSDEMPGSRGCVCFWGETEVPECIREKYEKEEE